MKNIKQKSLLLCILLAFMIILFIPSKSYSASFMVNYQLKDESYETRGVWGIYKALITQGADWINAPCNYYNRR